jgi:hypothetical protein
MILKIGKLKKKRVVIVVEIFLIVVVLIVKIITMHTTDQRRNNMGYCIYIKSETEIIDFDEIVESLPKNYKGEWFGKQDWGYTCLTDIQLCKDKKGVTVSGSFSMSGKYAEGMTLQLMNRLLKKGYKVICESINYNL